MGEYRKYENMDSEGKMRGNIDSEGLWVVRGKISHGGRCGEKSVVGGGKWVVSKMAEGKEGQRKRRAMDIVGEEGEDKEVRGR